MAKESRYRYEIVLYWSDEDRAYIAEVPQLAWCAADGATYEEALANVEVIIDEWMETALEKGWPIPEPKGRRLVSA
jgi:predicted RNase H-like HicB family nuclease